MQSVRTKLVVVIVALLVVFGAILCVFSSFMSVRSTMEALQLSMVETASLVSQRISEKCKTTLNSLQVISSDNTIISDYVLAAQKAEYLDLKKEEYGFAQLVMASGKGNLFNGEGSVASDAAFLAAVNEGKSTISDPEWNEELGSMNIKITAPIIDSTYNTVLGVIICTLPSDYLTGVTNDISIGSSGLTYIINSEGIIVAHSDADMVKNRQSSKQLMEKDASYQKQYALESDLMAGNSGFGEYTTGNVAKLMAYSPIPDTRWGVVISAAKSDFTKSLTQTIVWMFIIAAVTLAAAVLLSVRLSSKIVNPIRSIMERLELLAKGDLSSPVRHTGAYLEAARLNAALESSVATLNSYVSDISTSLGAIAEGNLTKSSTLSYIGDFEPIHTALESILSSLKDFMSQVSQASEQLEHGASQVAGGSQTLAQGSSEQASSIELLSTSINEVSTQTDKNIQGAKNARTITVDTGRRVQVCSKLMEELSSSMKEIDKSSKEISKIISVIDEISFQTNLLSLNAAVEAARAGTAGAGFAVVADEVRRLAGKSAEAARETGSLIENAIQKAAAGSTLANQTQSALSIVVEKTNSVTELVGKIASSSEAQGESISQVSDNIRQISGVVQANSATAQESAALSEELAGQVDLLRTLAGHFKLS